MGRTIETETDHVQARVEDKVCIITLNRPERRNALSDEMLRGLEGALADAETATDVGAVVVTGAGGAFCAGGDVKGMADASSGGRGGDASSTSGTASGGDGGAGGVIGAVMVTNTGTIVSPEGYGIEIDVANEDSDDHDGQGGHGGDGGHATVTAGS